LSVFVDEFVDMERYPQNRPQNSAFLWMDLWMEEEDNSFLQLYAVDFMG